MTTVQMPLSRMRVLIAGIVVFGLMAIPSAARAFEPEAKPPGDPSPAFFTQHCKGCHAGDKPKGKFRVESLTQDFADKENRQRWLKVQELVKAGTMPPSGKPRPPAEDVRTVTDWISARVAAAETARSAQQGRVVLRRLN